MNRYERLSAMAVDSTPSTNGQAKKVHKRKKDAGDAKPKKTQADLLVEIAIGQGIELFHAPDGDAYATVPVGDWQATYRVNCKAFRLWLGRLYYKQTKRSPGSQAVQDSLGILGGKALFEGKRIPVFVRIAAIEDAVFIDLGDDTWAAVEITADGWSIIARPPVKFIRPRGLLALERPAQGGSLQDLKPFVNVASDEEFVLVLAFLVACLRGKGPFPGLNVNGEQGSGKSTFCRMLRSLVDPNESPLRTQPRDERDLMIAATNSWIVGFDNFSRIWDWLSDALCRLATGGGFSTRALYSDSEEKIFDAQRPVLLNGIEDVLSRPDLLDRFIAITLRTIPEEKRQTEAELWAEFQRVKPRILGALYDAVSTALRRVRTVKLAKMPRMADFAVWAVAAEPAFGVPSGSFMKAYNRNREGMNEAAIENSVIAAPLLLLRAGCSWHVRGSWRRISITHRAWAQTTTCPG